MRALRITFILVVLAITPLQIANAHTTMCDYKTAAKFGYGAKMRAIVWVPRKDGGAFRKQVDAFFDKAGYFNSAVEGFYEGKPSAPHTYDQLPQSQPLGITFTINTRSDSDFAFITLNTFSFECTKTQDWRPYWAKFGREFLATSGKPYFSWRVLFSRPYTTVSG